IAGRQLVNRPEGRSFLAFGPGALQVLEDCQQQRHRMDGGDRFEIRLWNDDNIHGTILRGPHDQTLWIDRLDVLSTSLIDNGERFDGSISTARAGCRRYNGVCYLEQVDDFTSDQFRSSYMQHQR